LRAWIGPDGLLSMMRYPFIFRIVFALYPSRLVMMTKRGHGVSGVLSSSLAQYTHLIWLWSEKASLVSLLASILSSLCRFLAQDTHIFSYSACIDGRFNRVVHIISLMKLLSTCIQSILLHIVLPHFQGCEISNITSKRGSQGLSHLSSKLLIFR
jgi:hypothetical protein